MNDKTLNALKSLHTSAVDARNGYDEALKDAEGKGMTPLFSAMISIHEKNAQELKTELLKSGAKADDNGSFMTTVHQTIMDVRSMFSGLDQSVLPGLIDGENRNIKKYDDALAADALPTEITTLLSNHRERLAQALSIMKADRAKIAS